MDLNQWHIRMHLLQHQSNQDAPLHSLQLAKIVRARLQPQEDEGEVIPAHRQGHHYESSPLQHLPIHQGPKLVVAGFQQGWVQLVPELHLEI